MQHHPSGWPPWPPSSSANGHDLGLGLIIGEIRAQAVQTHEQLHRIDCRLEAGDARMSELSDRIGHLERRPSSEVPPAERLIKDGLRYLVPLGVLWGTGSVDAAAMWLKMLAGK